MDGTQFDLLTRSIARRLSRRLTFKALTAGLAAGALSQVDQEPAGAARCQSLGKSCKKRRGKPRPKCCSGSVCRGNRCQCKPGRQKCGNKCITKKQCCRNNQCPNNQRCDKKTNKCGCGKNQKRCQGRCIPKSQCCTNADCGVDQICGPQNTCVAAACSENDECDSGVCACGDNPGSGVCVAPTFVQTFQNNLSGWISSQNSTDRPASESMSLGNGFAVVKSGNAYEPIFDPTAFSRLGGYSSEFPSGGFDVSIQVYLDLDDTSGNLGFAYTAGTVTDTCDYRRDFIFTAGTNSDASKYCVKISNNVNESGILDACNDSGTAEVAELTGDPGWYTFVHEFRDDDGVLAVTMKVLDSSGAVVHSGVRRNAADTIATNGGHRHAWFPIVTRADGIRIRNSTRTNLE